MFPSSSVQGGITSQGSNNIERPRLLQRLQSTLDHKLTLITAPPGFGKTTLVAQLIRTVQLPVAWQTIDERSRDLPNLYSQAINALSVTLPSIRQLAPPYGYSAGELATLIANHLVENLTGELVYVLDDVHWLAGAAPAETWLRSLVTTLPPACHLILASRTLPRLPLVEMIARGEVLAIGLDELRFTPTEIGELGTALLGVRPAEDRIKQLLARLEGWPAGTILALQPLPPELEQTALSGEGGPEALFEALARITLQAQPLGVRNFLLASSTLTRLTPEACTEALGLSNSIQMLAEIQARNLFVTRAAGALVYHTLFRTFLQTALKEADQDTFTDLHTRAAHWFETNDQPDEAFDHYLRAELPTAAAALSEHLAVAYFAQNRVETLLTWNNQLRGYAVPAPRLAFRCAMIYTDRYEYAAAEERLREAEANRQPEQADVSLAAIHIQYGQINVQRGNYQQAVDYVSDLMESEPSIRGRVLNILGMAALQIGHTEQAIQNFEAALPFYRSFADNYVQSQLLQSLASAYWRAGRLTDALAAFQEIVAVQRSLSGTGPLALALTSLGYVYHHLGDYKHAVATFQEGLSAIAGFRNRRAEGYLLFNLADVRRDQGEMEEALDLYNQALNAVGDSEPSLTCTILCGIATLHRWQDQIPDAVAAAQAADKLAQKHSIGMEGRTARIALSAARTNVDPVATLQALDLVTVEFENQGERFELLPALGLCASAALLIQHLDTAEHYLDKALKLTQAIGTAVPLAIEILHVPALDTFIRQKARKYGAIVTAVDQLRLLQTRTDQSMQAEALMPNQIYSLRIITLGQARIICDGKSISTSEWRPAARDLFLYLVFTKEAARDQICLSFWPDSSPKRARDSFHTTMYRIREVLGENVILLHDSGDGGVYAINPDINLWCDAYELEALAAQARVLPPSDARTEDLWRRAVGLYNGEFLPTLDFDWAVEYRELLHDAYVESLVGLGRCIQARGNYREAIEIFKRALKIEPYREDIHQAIMMCHVVNGAKHKAMAQLNQLRTLLRKDLGIGPSKETLQLAKTLFA